MSFAKATTQVQLGSAIVRNPLIVSPDTTVITAIVRMYQARSTATPAKERLNEWSNLQEEARASCILVENKGQVIGILTHGDILKLNAQQQPLEHLSVQQVMSHPIITLQESHLQDFCRVVNLLQQHHIHHLPLLNEQKQLVGLITHASLLQALGPLELYQLTASLEVRIEQLEAEKKALQESSVIEPEQQFSEQVSEQGDTILSTALTPSARIAITDAPGVITNANDRCFDTTPLQQFGTTLQTTTEVAEQFFSLALDLFCITNAEGKFLRLNPQWEKVLGYSLAHLEGRQWLTYIHPDDLEATLKVMVRLQAGETTLNFTNRYGCQDGSYRWLEWCSIPQGGLIYSTARDITEHKQTAAQLQQSNEALAKITHLKDEFLAIMSHELRTPLNSILGMTEALQDGIFGQNSQEQVNALQTIEQSGLHLLELINDILDVARIESGQPNLTFSLRDITILCKSSLSFIKQQALKKHIQIEINLPAGLPQVLVDERRIRQVLINVLSNAVKFTPEGGHITLEVSRRQQATPLNSPPLQGITRVKVYRTVAEQELGLGALPSSFSSQPGQTFKVRDYLRITITDTGIGIAPDQIERLFQPFVQIDSALNRRYPGTGLGLVLVKRIIELHGGQVELTSKVGIGSCFTIDLPIEEQIRHYPIDSENLQSLE